MTDSSHLSIDVSFVAPRVCLLWGVATPVFRHPSEASATTPPNPVMGSHGRWTIGIFKFSLDCFFSISVHFPDDSLRNQHLASLIFKFNRVVMK